MGWFEDQLKERIETDRDKFEDSFIELSATILGEKGIIDAMKSNKKKTRNAIEEIIKYYNCQVVKVPDEIEDVVDQMDYMMRPTGIMKRRVKLEDKWWESAVGAMLGSTKDGQTIALIPRGVKGYCFKDYKTGKTVKVDRKTSKNIEREAYCFYKPFPQKELKIWDLAKFIWSLIRPSDIVFILIMYAVSQAFAMLSPVLNKLVYESLIPSGIMASIMPLMTLFVGIGLSQTLIGITSSLIQSRLTTRLSVSISSASMMRMLSMPTTFFKDYNAGELAQRMTSISTLCNTIIGVASKVIGVAFSLTYIVQMVAYGPSLVIPGLIIIAVTIAVNIYYTLKSIDISRKQLKTESKLTGLIFALFSGVQKIKLAGAEKRAFSKWASVYREQAEYVYDKPMFLKVAPVLTSIISTAGSMVIYYFAAISSVGLANYMAFNTAYGGVFGALTTLAGIVTTIATIKPTIELAEPLMKTAPEVSEDKHQVTRLKGNIEVNNLSFRYTEDGPLILDNLSLKIKPGDYVAIVGKTGCGKSTLLRLLLGFEKPQKGAIYYDGQSVDKVDLKSLRRNIGVVMQNGELFSGDIFSNIVISAPQLTLDDAWEAAKMAGIAEDIEKMPMEMHTMISEGGGGISGGQKQRLMIARAIAPKPKVLMFDEATSALDNVTQKLVSDSISQLKATRIVIAHRLSTIKNCDRIIVIDGGKIIEDGKFDELIEKGGYFAELVKRQMA